MRSFGWSIKKVSKLYFFILRKKNLSGKSFGVEKKEEGFLKIVRRRSYLELEERTKLIELIKRKNV